MKRAIGVMVMAMMLTTTPLASAGPPRYITCPGGYVVPVGQDCPPFRTPISLTPGRPPTGGGGGGGLLGTIGRIVDGLPGVGGLGL